MGPKPTTTKLPTELQLPLKSAFEKSNLMCIGMAPRIPEPATHGLEVATC